MAESKFLPYQDKTGTGIPDVCDDVIEVAEPPCEDCKCIENSSAAVPNWRRAPSGNTFLNGKNCFYQLVLETKYETTWGSDASGTPYTSDPCTDEVEYDDCVLQRMQEIYEEHREQAADLLLTAYGKDDGAASRRTVEGALEATDYFLAPRARSHLRLLWSIPYNILCGVLDKGEEVIEEVVATEEDPDTTGEGEKFNVALHLAGQGEDEYGIEPGDMEVSYTIEEFKQLLTRVRKGLHLYNAYYQKAMVEDGVGLFYLDDPDLAGAKFDLALYGDMGVFGAKSSSDGKYLAKIFPTLAEFVAKDGYKIHGIRPEGGYDGFMGLFGDRIEEFAFLFNKDYKLKRLVIFTEECGEIPVVYEEEDLDKDPIGLNQKSPWNDRSAMGYLVHLSKMERDLTAREPMGWLEFIKLYTYPTIYDEINQGYSNTDPEASVASCIADALEEELKQLGQDIFSGEFSITDTFESRFNENLCESDHEEVLDRETKLLQMEDPDDPNAGQQSVKALALAQAFETLEQDDPVFGDLCTALLSGAMFTKDWWAALEKIRICGLTAAQKDALTCLMGEVTLEEALSAVAEKALRALSVENFGDLFIGLPADKQAELDALVQQKFENGEFFAPGSSGQALSDSIASGGDSSSTSLTNGTWSGNAYFETSISAGTYKYEKTKVKNGELVETGMTHTGLWVDIDVESRAGAIQTEESLERRTLVQQFDLAARAGEELDANTVVGAYIIALLEVYDDAMMELLSELNKFPGNELILTVVEALDCPTTPILNPSFFDWINDKQLNLCRTTDPIKFPGFQNPASWLPKFADLTGLIFEALKYAIQQAVFYILTQIFIKICEILGNAACSALGAGGAALASLADGSRSKVSDAIRESICGEDADAETIDDTLVDLVGTLGVGPSVAFANAEQIASFMGDVSSAVTTEELYEAMLGNASQEFLIITDTILKWDDDYAPFRVGLNNPEKIASLFAGVGNCMPAAFKNQMKGLLDYYPDPPVSPTSPTPVDVGSPAAQAMLLPANPSLCLTEEQVEAFNQLRSAILDGRASPSQIEHMGTSAGQAWEGAGPPGADGTSAPGLNAPVDPAATPPGGYLPEPSGIGGPTGFPGPNALGPGNPSGGGPLDDLGDVLDVLANGPSNYIADNLPPLLSTPGCSDGLLPYETEEAAATATGALNGLLEQLKIDLAYDMMGNGAGKANWGLMNMILSDTMGYPYTAHLRKVAGRGKWVDFYMDPDNPDNVDDDGEPLISPGAGKVPRFTAQRGALPYKVGAWLQDYLVGIDSSGESSGTSHAIAGSFASNNAATTVASLTTYKSLAASAITSFNGNFEYRQLPLLPYNTTVSVEMSDDYDGGGRFVFAPGIRKKTPDYTLSYFDNIKGLHNDARFEASVDAALGYATSANNDTIGHQGCTACNSTTALNTAGLVPGTIYDAGFELEVYLSDLMKDPDTGKTHNYPYDSVRVEISDVQATNSRTWTMLAAMIPSWLATGRKIPKWIYDKIITTELASPLRPEVDKWTLKPNNAEPSDTSVDLKYSFLATDNTIDNIDLSPYPKFLSTFETHTYKDYLPQTVLLSEIIGQDFSIHSASIHTGYDAIMAEMVNKFLIMVGENEKAFLYGASYDNLSFDDIEYVLGDAVDGNTFQDSDAGAATSSTPYAGAQIYDEEEESYRRIKNSDQIMGTSAMEVELGEEDNRVIYLDPLIFGGSFMNPPLYIKPVTATGWQGMVDVLFPEMSPCKPYRTDLIDFSDIQEQVDDNYPTIPEDERLKSDPDCVVEVPYARILDRAALSGIESIISAAIRIYVSSFFIRGMATFTKFAPKFPDVFSSVCASFIVEEMEASFKDAQGARWEYFNVFKDNDFWYSFLEQSVQLYSRLVDSGDIPEPPEAIIDALVRLNDMQQEYEYPMKEDVKDGRREEFKWNKYIGKKGLKKYRQNQNLNAVAATADDAKMALKELVMLQLNQMGEKFLSNLKTVGMEPDIFDLDYYVLQDLSQGSSLELDKEIQAEYEDFPSHDNSDDHYTYGGEFALPDGTEYVGYYHVVASISGTEYQTGASSGDSVVSELLSPFASKTTIPIGDVAWIGEADVDTASVTQPFMIEKYIKVDNSYKTYDEALSQFETDTTIYETNDEGDSVYVSGPNLTQNVSDVYPGRRPNQLRLVTDDSGNVVGVEGELGVRHGLRFSVIVDGAAYTATEVEIDALDVPLSQVDSLQADSKLLFCLVNLLKEDDKFKLVAQYVFPFKKLTGVTAIYNALAFLPSIGEKVAADNQTYGRNSVVDEDVDEDGNSYKIPATKLGPGASIVFTEEIEPAGDPEGDPPAVTLLDPPEIKDSETNPGSWASKLDRDPGLFGGLFVQEWDAWDQVLLRNSKARIKKIFKSYYNGRDFSPGESTSESPGEIITAEFKEKFSPRPGQSLLPWWKKRLLRTNPFNADGELCEEKD